MNSKVYCMLLLIGRGFFFCILGLGKGLEDIMIDWMV